MNPRRRDIAIFLILLITIITEVFFIFSQNFFQKFIFLLQKESKFFEEKFPSQTSEVSSPGLTLEPEESISQLGQLPEIFYPARLLPQNGVKAVYLTSWSAATKARVEEIIEMVKDTEINTVVVDVKDWSGFIAYDTDVPEAAKYRSERVIIPDISAFLEKFHKEGIPVIARIVVFQDPVLAAARPDLAVKSKTKSQSKENSLWFDNAGLAWVDPGAKEAWDYNIAITKDVLKRGFDEVNFDYVRFPSDGNLKDMSFSFWDGITARNLIIKEFYQYLREKLPQATLSIDLFGLSTTAVDSDLGIGQIIEDAFLYFDFVCPMVYPSHYASGFLGYQNPAEHPYEVVKYSMEGALEKLNLLKKLEPGHLQLKEVKLRSWLQDFDLGANYGKKEVLAEIKAVVEALGENFSGFMLWNSENIYTKQALLPAETPLLAE